MRTVPPCPYFDRRAKRSVRALCDVPAEGEALHKDQMQLSKGDVVELFGESCNLVGETATTHLFGHCLESGKTQGSVTVVRFALKTTSKTDLCTNNVHAVAHGAPIRVHG